MSTEDYQDIQNSSETQSEKESAPAGEVTIEGLQSQVATLAAAYESAKEQSLRAQADAQNARRRAEQDIEKAHKYGLEKMVNDLLPVVDNLERALATIDSSNEAFRASQKTRATLPARHCDRIRFCVAERDSVLQRQRQQRGPRTGRGRGRYARDRRIARRVF